MCCCMAFLSYFAFCSVLFFRVGSVPDAASLVLFATECLILLFTCVQFYRDPCSFDYFRFSFALSQLAMNHYFLHMLCLLTCSVLLVAMSEIAVAAVACLWLSCCCTLRSTDPTSRRETTCVPASTCSWCAAWLASECWCSSLRRTSWQATWLWRCSWWTSWCCCRWLWSWVLSPPSISIFNICA